MKKGIKRIISVFTIVILFFFMISLNGAYAKESQIDSFEYSIDSDDPRWQFMSIKEKRDALLIPEDILRRMTDSCLLEVFLKYPFLCDILAYDRGDGDWTIPLQNLSEYCSSYQEILRRSLTIHEMLFSLNKDEANLYKSEPVSPSISSEAEEAINKIKGCSKYREGDILTIEVIVRDLQMEAMSNPVIYKKLVDRTLSSEYVKTPAGTDVEVLVLNDLKSLDVRENIGKNWAKKYGVEYLAPATVRYNCHSYAWYWPSTENTYWMQDPSSYMLDGSYKRGGLISFSQTAVDAGLESGQRIYYGTYGREHSAIVDSSVKLGDSVGANYGISKFGRLGLYRHRLGHVPYPTDDVSSWR